MIIHPRYYRKLRLGYKPRPFALVSPLCHVFVYKKLYFFFSLGRRKLSNKIKYELERLLVDHYENARSRLCNVRVFSLPIESIRPFFFHPYDTCSASKRNRFVLRRAWTIFSIDENSKFLFLVSSLSQKKQKINKYINKSKKQIKTFGIFRAIIYQYDAFAFEFPKYRILRVRSYRSPNQSYFRNIMKSIKKWNFHCWMKFNHRGDQHNTLRVCSRRCIDNRPHFVCFLKRLAAW